jgi:cytosolic carboxypeptidase protein 5
MGVGETAQGVDEEVGGLHFCSRFDSGNLARVERSETGEYLLWTAPDCAGTPHEQSYTTWFYFSVRGARKGQIASFTVMNSNNQRNLYNNDMRVS